MYYSEYETAFLERLALRLLQTKAEQTWCIFDNTVSGAAAGNALTVMAAVEVS
jgi:uncharacterized protein YecE (DUF72 family)